ncbi:cytochrome P450 [Aspergillus ruber CBS 135680]|uniref:Cytochrome P450 n=1 Tax=Aspergillus ruber (strain CBS 135680) TaxID=1388766 RepID=A0A017SK03_ASPRC|nr:cytochrome P450 [Aspergillus ruber CBS 135680]EYE96635.1 cytochrome P450 [Aspergillus ruber CBS 135680]
MEENRHHRRYTMELVQKRLANKNARKDFLTKIIEAREYPNISNIQIAAHSSYFVIAGSETTATTLACVTYYLLRNPDILDRLKKEIRTVLIRYEDIDAVNTNSLSYLRAVTQEPCVFPPLPFASPRVVPVGGSTVDGHYLPGGSIVSTSPLAASMSPTNLRIHGISIRNDGWDRM